MQQTQTVGQDKEDKMPLSRMKRKPEEGNVLWRLYTELGYTDREAFWAHLAAVPVAQSTFSRHSQAERSLGSLSTLHFMSYRVFFLEHGGHDLLSDFLNELPDATPYQAAAL